MAKKSKLLNRSFICWKNFHSSYAWRGEIFTEKATLSILSRKILIPTSFQRKNKAGLEE